MEDRTDTTPEQQYSTPKIEAGLMRIESRIKSQAVGARESALPYMLAVLAYGYNYPKFLGDIYDLYAAELTLSEETLTERIPSLVLDTVRSRGWMAEHYADPIRYKKALEPRILHWRAEMLESGNAVKKGRPRGIPVNADRLRKLRGIYSQEDFADKCGVSISVIKRGEQGKAWDAATHEKVEQAIRGLGFDCPTGYLAGSETD